MASARLWKTGSLYAIRHGPMRAITARITGSHFFRCRIALRIFDPFPLIRHRAPGQLKVPLPCPLLAPGKDAGVEFHGLGQMREKILGVVSAGIRMKCVLDALTRQLAIELVRALGKAVFVFLAAIEVDGLTLNLGAVFTCQVKRVVGL